MSWFYYFRNLNYTVYIIKIKSIFSDKNKEKESEIVTDFLVDVSPTIKETSFLPWPAWLSWLEQCPITERFQV